MHIDIPLWFGIAGMALILVAFLLNQVNVWSNDSLLYDFTNFLGSSALLYYAWVGDLLPFIVLNAVWAVFSLKDVFLDLSRIRK